MYIKKKILYTPSSLDKTEYVHVYDHTFYFKAYRSTYVPVSVSDAYWKGIMCLFCSRIYPDQCAFLEPRLTANLHGV